MVKQKSQFNPRKQRQFLRSVIPFILVVAAISGLIIYIWIYSEINETLKELEIQQTAVIELNDEINTLKGNIEYLVRVDVLTARASDELDMVFTAPETIAIYVDESAIIDNK